MKPYAFALAALLAASAHGFEITCHYSDFDLTIYDSPDRPFAFMAGNQATIPVHRVHTDNHRAYLEITAAGNLTLTSVFLDGTSIHSRHMLILGEVVATQLTGHCE